MDTSCSAVTAGAVSARMAQNSDSAPLSFNLGSFSPRNFCLSYLCVQGFSKLVVDVGRKSSAKQFMHHKSDTQ